MRILFLIFLSVFAGLLQGTGFSVFEIKPDMVLVFSIVSAFFIFNIWEGIFVWLVSVLFLKFSSGFNPELLLIPFFGAVSFVSRLVFPWKLFFAVFANAIFATSVFYLIFGPQFLLSAIFLKEFALNVAFAILLAGILRLAIGDPDNLRIRI